jgi:hypothetical protein
MVNHQSHKLTTYTFGQAIEAVLGEPTELVLPEVRLMASDGLWWPLMASGGLWWPLMATDGH